jgi:mutator protein MutT
MKNNEKTPKNEVVLGVIKNSVNKVLIVSRAWPEKSLDGSAMLTWAFPGGEIDEGETQEEALIREVRSETGFKVKVLDKISERIHPQFNVKIHYFSCEIIPGSMRPISDVHEIESTKWVDVSELRNYFTSDLDPNVAKFLKI